MKESELLDKAAERMQTYGYSHNLGGEDNGCGCFLHHIAAIIQGPLSWHPAYAPARDRLKKFVPSFRPDDLAKTDMTQERAAKILRDAAEQARAEGK